MTIKELAYQETELYASVVSINGTMEEKYKQLEQLGIFEAYKKIHQEYARQNKKDSEALKRGLFLCWYSRTEPSCFTGIGDLDPKAEEAIIHTLDRRFSKNISDYELDWMLSYYSSFEFVFGRFTNYKSFYSKLTHWKTEMPDSIDREEMSTRGQMGIYWNSLTRYHKDSNTLRDDYRE